MKPVRLSLVFALCAVPVSLCLAAAADKTQVQAKVLDQNQYACASCFFGQSTYYFCFEADNKVLIGYEKIPTMNWIDPNKNWLTKAHKSWRPWAADGETIPLRYDEKHIWVTGPNGKQVKLNQDYSTDIFINDQRCRTAIKRK
ncbi:MAG TPA: hypothetical protein VK789_24515 [Bryobacteraceae bacterium]|jgi:hypothetical protein|nr:hypothetical protein [Bryobacteraceae bacterium]